MLDFWYSARCTRQVKLLLCIGTFILLYYCAKLQEIPRGVALFSLLLGCAVHLIYQIRLHSKLRKYLSYSTWLYLGLGLIAVGLIIWLPEVNKSLAAIQIIGYSLLGFFLISIYSQRSRRSAPDT